MWVSASGNSESTTIMVGKINTRFVNIRRNSYPKFVNGRDVIGPDQCEISP